MPLGPWGRSGWAGLGWASKGEAVWQVGWKGLKVTRRARPSRLPDFLKTQGKAMQVEQLTPTPSPCLTGSVTEIS